MVVIILIVLDLPIFSQPNVTLPYGHEMQAAAGTMYNRQMSDLQNAANVVDKNNAVQSDNKKAKRRKGAKSGKSYKYFFIVVLILIFCSVRCCSE